MDDEADAASLNTNSDKLTKDASTINKLLNDIKIPVVKACLSSWLPRLNRFYYNMKNLIGNLNLSTSWSRRKYIGGNFVFSDPPSYIVRFIDSELDDMKDESGELPKEQTGIA